MTVVDIISRGHLVKNYTNGTASHHLRADEDQFLFGVVFVEGN